MKPLDHHFEERPFRFTYEDIQSRLRNQPFVPARFVLTTGETYDIYHRNLVLVGRRFLIIGMPAPDVPGVADQVTRVPLIHVAEIRDLPSPIAQPKNGPA